MLPLLNHLDTLFGNKLIVYEICFVPLIPLSVRINAVFWITVVYLSTYLDRIILHSLVCQVTSLTVSSRLT